MVDKTKRQSAAMQNLAAARAKQEDEEFDWGDLGSILAGLGDITLAVTPAGAVVPPGSISAAYSAIEGAVEGDGDKVATGVGRGAEILSKHKAAKKDEDRKAELFELRKESILGGKK